MFSVTENLTKFIWRKCKMLQALGMLVSSKFFGLIIKRMHFKKLSPFYA